MKRVMTGGLVALLLAALIGLLSMASIGSAAPTARQYNKPVLTLSVSDPAGFGNYFVYVQGAGYDPGSAPTGTFTLTCAKGTACADAWLSAWGPPSHGGTVDGLGTFVWYSPTVVFCPSNVKTAVATDTNGVKSNSVKAPC